MSRIGLLLKQYRNENKFTQNELIEKLNCFANLNIDTKTLSSWENGVYFPNINNRKNILKFIKEYGFSLYYEFFESFSNNLEIRDENYINIINKVIAGNFKENIGRFPLENTSLTNYELNNINEMDGCEYEYCINFIDSILYENFNEKIKLRILKGINDRCLEIKVLKINKIVVGYTICYWLNDKAYNDIINFKRELDDYNNDDYSNSNYVTLCTYSLTKNGFSLMFLHHIKTILKKIKRVKSYSMLGKSDDIERLTKKYLNFTTKDEYKSKNFTEYQFYTNDIVNYLSDNLLSKIIFQK